jgi:hypothetical protein
VEGVEEMKCENCFNKKIREVKDDHAFDTEHRQLFIREIDYCIEHDQPCDDAYLTCPYREITVEARHIEFAISKIEDHIKHPDIYTLKTPIYYLYKILLGEDLE